MGDGLCRASLLTVFTLVAVLVGGYFWAVGCCFWGYVCKRVVFFPRQSSKLAVLPFGKFLLSGLFLFPALSCDDGCLPVPGCSWVLSGISSGYFLARDFPCHTGGPLAGWCVLLPSLFSGKFWVPLPYSLLWVYGFWIHLYSCMDLFLVWVYLYSMWGCRVALGLPGGLGLFRKSCRLVDVLCFPIWMGSISRDNTSYCSKILFVRFI